MRLTDLPDRIFTKIMPVEDGCWLWTSSLDSWGYGKIKRGGKQPMAHRVVYELLVGPIPEETLDHLCRVKHCVNPAHLEPVSVKENILRSDGIAARNARKTHCPRGHPLSGDNLYEWSRGGKSKRRCRTCDKALKQRVRSGLVSRELWAVERCEHGYRSAHIVNPCSGPCLIPQEHDDCPGEKREPLDFDAIWRRYYDGPGNRRHQAGLTYDELWFVVYGEKKEEE